MKHIYLVENKKHSYKNMKAEIGQNNSCPPNEFLNINSSYFCSHVVFLIIGVDDASTVEAGAVVVIVVVVVLIFNFTEKDKQSEHLLD
jgi:hypothetical protein